MAGRGAAVDGWPLRLTWCGFFTVFRQLLKRYKDKIHAHANQASRVKGKISHKKTKNISLEKFVNNCTATHREANYEEFV